LKTGVYLHIPFCLSKCGYCNFFSVPYSSASLKNYYTVILKEIELFKQLYEFLPDTVYFGGGTPSLLSAEQLTSIIELLAPVPEAEITLEVNPIQVTQEWVKLLAQTKVNRLSLGLQSMDNETLRSLGRKHKAESIPDKINLCRDYGFSNLSLDLLYGYPASTNDTIKADLEKYIALKPEHISTYLLSIEKEVPLHYWKDMLPDDTELENQYNTICDVLGQSGWEQYELSNFSRRGYQSKHNLHYWMGDDYIGMGAGASGYINKTRYKRPEDLTLWQHSVERKDVTYQIETETKAQQKADFIIMQLRLTQGLDLTTYRKLFSSDFLADFTHTVERLITSGYLQLCGHNIKLTSKARFVSNHILQEFV
jgi:oxygen-independent coproporphyrinogen-3 oxidase